MYNHLCACKLVLAQCSTKILKLSSQPYLRKAKSAEAEALLSLKLQQTSHSERKLVTGFATAAFIAWKLIVNKAINNASPPVNGNIHQPISIL